MRCVFNYFVACPFATQHACSQAYNIYTCTFCVSWKLGAGLPVNYTYYKSSVASFRISIKIRTEKMILIKSDPLTKQFHFQLVHNNSQALLTTV